MDMKRHYYEDIQIFQKPVHVFWFVVLLLGLVILPLVTRNYTMSLVNFIAINVIVTLGLNLLVGYTGQISLGHGGFVAIGAYATVLLMQHLGLNFFPALVLAGFVAAGFGFLLGLPALRLEGPYLAIATLGFGMAVTQIIGRSTFFGGRMGLKVPKINIAGLTLSSDKELYVVIISITVLMAFAMRNLTRSRVGRALIAIRESDIAAETLGVNLAWYKTLSFAVSAFYAGVAGGLLAIIFGYINPSIFDFVMSILFLAMVVVGGAGAILGSILGGIVVTFLDLKLNAVTSMPLIGDLLREISTRWMSVSGLPNFRSVLFGILLILFVVFEPHGLYGIWLRIKKYWKTWPF